MKNDYNSLYNGCKIYVVSDNSYEISEYIIDSIHITTYTNYVSEELEQSYSVKYHNDRDQISSWKIHSDFFLDEKEVKEYVVECCEIELNQIYKRAEQLKSIINKNK